MFRSAVILLLAGVAPLSAQDSLVRTGSRITNPGVIRASAATDSVFVLNKRSADTVDIGDFASYMIARIGAPRFEDSLGIRVHSDSQRIRIAGRMTDFPPEYRKELGPIFFFIDSTAIFVAEISMPQRDSTIMRLRLERLIVNGIGVPEVFLIVALSQYAANHPTKLSASGREFHVELPARGHVKLLDDAIVLMMRPKKP